MQDPTEHSPKIHGDFAAIGRRYALITPVRDEATFIADMIESVAAQSTPPSRWIIVDDGSQDQTVRIIERYLAQLPYLELIPLPARKDRSPGGEGAIPQAMRRIDSGAFDFLARFDADIVLSRDYMTRILDEFARNPRLGIAGGGLYVQRNGGLFLEDRSVVHVRGALKTYRAECLAEIGGLSTQIGWDTLDEVTAWSRGWQTMSFKDTPAIHRRPTGRGISAARVYTQRGRAEYLTWSDPLFVLGKAFKIGVTHFSPQHALFYLWGFAMSYVRREPRAQDATIVSARRVHQRSRMRHMLRHRDNRASPAL